MNRPLTGIRADRKRSYFSIEQCAHDPPNAAQTLAARPL